MDREAEQIGRALWLEERRRGIGGTDAAAILGTHKWASPHDVYLLKTGQAPEKPDSPLLWWGRELEDIIARRYMHDTGRKVWKPDRMLYHPEHEELLANPDRLVQGEDRGVEIKTATVFMAREWGEAGTDEIPVMYAAQAAHYMAVTGFEMWDVAVLIGGSDFRIYTLRRDRDFEGFMVAALVKWWADHIVAGRAPAVDNGGTTAAWLRARFPTDLAPLKEAPTEANGVAHELARARAALKEWGERKDVAENRLKAWIGDAAGIKGDGWRATWKTTKPTVRTDWEAVAMRLVADLASVRDQGYAQSMFNDAMHQNTTEAPGSRRFLYTDHP